MIPTDFPHYLHLHRVRTFLHVVTPHVYCGRPVIPAELLLDLRLDNAGLAECRARKFCELALKEAQITGLTPQHQGYDLSSAIRDARFHDMSWTQTQAVWSDFARCLMADPLIWPDLPEGPADISDLSSLSDKEFELVRRHKQRGLRLVTAKDRSARKLRQSFKRAGHIALAMAQAGDSPNWRSLINADQYLAGLDAADGSLGRFIRPAPSDAQRAADDASLAPFLGH